MIALMKKKYALGNYAPDFCLDQCTHQPGLAEAHLMLKFPYWSLDLSGTHKSRQEVTKIHGKLMSLKNYNHFTSFVPQINFF